MDLQSLSSVIGVAVLAAFLLPAALIGVVVIAVVANRAEPDPSGRRPVAVYLYAVSFLSLFVTLLASLGVVARLCHLIGSAPSSRTPDFVFGGNGAGAAVGGAYRSSLRITYAEVAHPVGDAVTRDAVHFALVAAVAGVALLLHLRAAGRVSAGEPTRSGPIGRVRASYVAAVAFTCVALVVVSTIVAAFAVLETISPTIFGDSGAGRVGALRTIIPALYLAVASLAILAAHLRAIPPEQRPQFRRPAPVGALDDEPTDIGADPAPVGPVEPSDLSAREASGATSAAEELSDRPRPRPRPR